jgi:hypothetical protein
MWQSLKVLFTANVFPTICYVIAAFFLYAFFLRVGIPPIRDLDATAGTYLALALFMFMLPEAKRLKLGQLFEYEAKVQEIREDVKQFKEETRATLSAYTSLVSAISNTVSQNITVNLPGRAEATEAREDMDATLKHQPPKSELESQIEQFLEAEANDLSYALAKLRMQLERELRRVLGKRQDLAPTSDQEPRFLSARSLFTQFARQYPRYEGLSKSFDYVLRVCNAAIHGQFVPKGSAHEALSMGLSMLSELRTIETE